MSASRRFRRPGMVALIGALVVACVVTAPSSAGAAGLTPVGLGTAATYSVLSGASVGNTVTGPVTTLRGDLGVTAVDTITGFPPGVVIGATHNGDAQAVQARADLVTAYNDAAGRTPDYPFAGDLIGQTLTPGVYHSAAAITNTGILTLDAQGDTNAVFIFQVGGALGMAAATEVKLINGAQASRVFWQVNGAATLGATAKFAGTIMALDAIGVGANAIVNGRILARNGAVALNSNNVYTTPPSLAITGGATVTTNDSTPTIAGTTDAAVGRPVTVTFAGQSLATTVQAGGTWAVTAALVANGTHTVSASVTDANGNSASATQSVIVDTALPVVTIAGGAAAFTTDPTPTITGTTDVGVGRTVTLTIAAQTVTAVVQSDGTWSVTPATVSDGLQTVTASVTDPAGNPGSATQSLTVDTVPPTITITGGATALTNDATPTIAGTATSDVSVGATMTVTVAGQILTTTLQSGGSWTLTATTVADGTHSVVASATDAAGNPGSATQALTVDTVAPTVTITGGPTALTNDATPTITGTTTAAVSATVTVTLAGQTMTALVQIGGTWNVTPPTTVADGTHALTASVSDPAGNAGTATQSLTVDTTAPSITITGGPSALTNDATPSITGTTSDIAAGATVTMTVATQTLTATVQTGGGWTATAATIADGTHSVVASVVDAAGNSASASQSLSIDTVAPTVSISGGASALTNDATPTISGMTNAPVGTTVTVTGVGGSLTALVQIGGTWNVTPTTVADGTHVVVASISDPAGNVGSATQSLTTDTVLPIVTISGGTSALTNDGTPSVAGTTDVMVGTTVTITIAGQTLTTTVQVGGTWTVTPTTVADGTRVAVASVTDPAGNVGTASQALTIDTAPPTVTIIGGATSSTNDSTPTISGTTPDVPAGTTVVVTIAGQTLSTLVQGAGTWSVTAAVLTNATYTVAVAVTDTAGNTGSATQSLTVDTVLPDVTINGGAVVVTNDATPTISGFAAVPAGTTVTVTVAGQSLTALVQVGGAWNVTATTIADGTRTVVASASDSAGNLGSATQSLIVDTLAPAVAFSSGAAALTNDATPVINGTSSGVTVGATLTVTVAGQILTATVQAGGTWMVTAAHLLDGTHIVVVSVSDAAGNLASGSQWLEVDTVLPTVAIVGGGAALTNDSSPTISGSADVSTGATVTVSIAGQTMTALVQSGGTWNVTPTTVADGTHVVVALVDDLAGNHGSATHSLTIDTTAPTMSITGGAAMRTNDATPTVSGFTDAVVGTMVTVTISEQTLTATVQVGGTWTVTVASLLDGTRNLVASLTDVAGNGRSATQALTVDTGFAAMPLLDFAPAGPKRVFDTRPGESPNALRWVAKQKVGGVYELQVQLTDFAGFVPASGVAAVSLNVTVTNAEGDGYLSVYACGSRESISSLNYTTGQTVANAIIAPVSAGGTVCIFSSAPTDVVADINGWFAVGKALTSVGPKRVLDTRPGQSPQALRSVSKARIQAGDALEVQLTDLAGFVPSAGVGSVSLNVTATNPAADGFITVYDCGARELVSSVNYLAGQTVANAVIAPVSATGTVCFFTSTTTDLVVDINGWFKSAAGFTGVSPRRVVDTRAGESPNALRDVPKQKFGGASVLQVDITGLIGVVPATGVGAVSLNVIATNPDGDGFITIYSCGTRDEVSSLNYRAGQTVSNAVMAPVSATGTICLYSPTATDVVIDINGWFTNVP